MPAENILKSVGEQLFSEEAARVYAVLDGASVPDLLENLTRYQPEYECLYRGELEPDMAEVAPYLVRLEPDAQFTQWVIKQGWGKHWGVFAISAANMRAMRRHFRTFLIVYDADGKPLYFRYYDPRVLRLYLPTCNTDELKTVFGPVTHFMLEDEDSHVSLRFKMASGALQEERPPLV